MKAIVAVDNKWGIGRNNGLLFHLPKDMAFFKSQTIGKVVVMGGNTLLSFPGGKPLPGRTNIVLSSSIVRNDCTVVKTLEELFVELQKYADDDVYIIGGAMFYQTMIDYCSVAYVTKVNADGEATTFFPDLDQKDNWELIKASETEEDSGLEISFTEYHNTSPLMML